MYCPECDHSIPYRRALVAGTASRPIWCPACNAALIRKTSLATYIYVACSFGLGVFAAAAFGSGFVILLLLAADLIVDRLTVELVAPDADEDHLALRTAPTGQLAEATAALRDRSWLRRRIAVSMPPEVYLVEYNGWGMGYESVYVNGRLADRKSSFWFARRFEFPIGESEAVLELDVSLWCTIRSMVLRVGGEVVYAEGRRHTEEEWPQSR